MKSTRRKPLGKRRKQAVARGSLPVSRRCETGSSLPHAITKDSRSENRRERPVWVRTTPLRDGNEVSHAAVYLQVRCEERAASFRSGRDWEQATGPISTLACNRR